MKNSKMILGVNDKPPLPKWLLLSIQHVFAMFGLSFPDTTKVSVSAYFMGNVLKCLQIHVKLSKSYR